MLIPQGSRAPVALTFDLKGSTVDRKTQPGGTTDAAADPAPLKDMDVQHKFVIGLAAQAALKTQMTSDAMFLHTQRLMDYSLVVGVHFCSGDCVHPPGMPDRPTGEGHDSAAAAQLSPAAAARAVRQKYSHLLRRGLPGMWEDRPCVFFLGIIDILQTFDMGKRLEHKLKTRLLRKSTTGISAVHPDKYCERFVDENMAKFA